MHPTEDLVPLARFQLEPQVLVVHKDSPYQDIASFLEAYKAGNATIAGEASGGPAWMCATIMADTLGCGTSYIPYTDGGEALTALLGKNVDAVFGQLGEVYDQLAAGEVRALAFAEDKRVEQFPDIPTLTESGVDFVFPQWRGLFVRKGTPDEAIEYWEKSSRNPPSRNPSRSGLRIPVPSTAGWATRSFWSSASSRIRP